MNEVIIYTDGSCLGNPGKGGWAAVIINDGKEDIIFGSEKESTNNRMELTAAINALLKIKQDKKIKIYTDSKYCLLYTSPSPRDATLSRMPSSA